MTQKPTDCIHIFSINQTLAEDMPSQTTSQTNLMNHCVIVKLVIFCSAVVVLKHGFFYQHYLILDTLIQILAGPDSCIFGDITIHINIRGA